MLAHLSNNNCEHYLTLATIIIIIIIGPDRKGATLCGMQNAT